MSHLFLALYWITIGSTVTLAILLRILASYSEGLLAARISAILLLVAGFLALWFVSGYLSVNYFGKETEVVVAVESVAYLFVCAAEYLLLDLVLLQREVGRRTRRWAVVPFLIFALILFVARLPVDYSAALIRVLRIAKWSIAIIIIATGALLIATIAVSSRRSSPRIGRPFFRAFLVGIVPFPVFAYIDLFVLRYRFEADELLGMSYPLSVAGYFVATVVLIAITIRTIRSYRDPGRRVSAVAGGQLSPRELEVASLIVEGLTNRAIAEKLYISLPTVKNHLYSIYGKLGVKNRLALVRIFIRD